MEITINLDDVFRDENGAAEESFKEAIQRQVVARLSEDFRKRFFDRFDQELFKVLTAEIQEALVTRMPSFVDDLMNAEFTPVDQYGRSSEKTTFRDQLIKGINEQLVYKPKNCSFDENTFTKAVKAVVDEQLKAFRKEFTENIDATFRRDALAYAVAQLQERLGLPKKTA
jgi:hypothetical protein